MLCNCTRDDAGSHDLGAVLAVGVASVYSRLPALSDAVHRKAEGVASQVAVLPQTTSTSATGVALADFEDGDHECFDDGTEAGFAELAQQKLRAECETMNSEEEENDPIAASDSDVDLDESDLQLVVEEGMDVDAS